MTPSFHGIRQTLLGGFLLTLLAFSGCSEPEPTLQVGDVGFQEDVLRGLSPDRRLDLSAITAFLLAVAHEEEGALDELGAPLVQRRAEDRIIDRLRDDVRLRAHDVEEDALMAFYQQTPEHELVVRHLLRMAERDLPESLRDPAREAAEEALARARAGEPFPELAAELSEEPGAAERGGLLTPGRRGTWVPEFWEAASRLEEGEVSEVVETQYGFHVLRLEERRQVPFEEARWTVAREAARLLPDEGEWDAFLTDLTEGIQVDMGSVEEWWEAPAEGADPILARWEGGELTARDLAAVLPSLTAGEWRSLDRGDPELRAEWVEDQALRHRLLEEAQERGIQEEPPLRDDLTADWILEVGGWMSGLGVADGVLPREVGSRAQELLGATGQNLRLAREGLLERRPLLLEFRQVRMEGAPVEAGRPPGATQGS